MQEDTSKNVIIIIYSKIDDKDFVFHLKNRN